MKWKVLVTDPVSEKGIAILRNEPDIEVDVKKLSPAELISTIGNYHALIVRSETKVTKEVIEAANQLKVIGRAGAGLDNIDLEAASKKGIIVMNVPGGNTISAAEHTMSLILALSRNIPQSVMALKQGIWDRKKFTGIELFGKTLGIIGLGRIGSEVAKRAQAFGMRVIAYDPYISTERAQQVGVELMSLQEVIAQSDYISVHTPLTKDTKGLIGPKEFAIMKQGVRIINTARGGVVDEQALYENLKSGKVAGAALDVFEVEPPPKDHPLLQLDNCIATPHLGAATEEAQEKVGVEICRQIIDVLKGRGARNAANMPFIEPATLTLIGPYLTLAEKLGSLQAQLASDRIEKVEIQYSGEVAQYDVAPITIACLKGLLEPIIPETVNYVNAPYLAKERGIKVIESKSSDTEDFSTLIKLIVKCGEKISSAAGTLFAKNDLRIVRIDGYHVDIVPSGFMVILENEDRPGVIGKVGTILGENNINIAGMTLGRKERGGKAVTGLNVDDFVPESVLEKIRQIPLVISAKLVKL